MSNWYSDTVCPECKGKKSSVFTICKCSRIKKYPTCKKCYEREKKFLDYERENNFLNYERKKEIIWLDDNKSNMQEDNFFKDTIPKCLSCSSYGRPIKHFIKDCPKQQEYKDRSYELNDYGY
ncbi:3318_t:CDS:2 [Scutellospora calospora]|uniref:3318_t:CDS:1 n=1 Tax=Scutellospora calospora TaxID=85575 RepID=A0ACA9K953_9GLOM|nr:3318_t:CDS:2 [Scutellospora calospora]